MKTLNLIISLGGLIIVLECSDAFCAEKVPTRDTRGGLRSGGTLLAVKPEPTWSQSNSAAGGREERPTYLKDVMPILMGKCFRCHNEQTKFLNNWLDYREAYADRWEIKRRVWASWHGDYFKQPMPTVNSPESEAISEDERRLIKNWVDTGAIYGVPGTGQNPHSKAERMELGKRLFTTVCAACHQPSGQGIPNRFPPLAGSDFLNSDKDRAIQVVLKGLQGEVVVNGLKFNNSMPMFPLSDGEIAAALTYVYNSFGNSGKDVTPEEVKSFRGQPMTPTGFKGNVSSAPAEKSPWE
jgi:mono/diheme cytochrome c family protein